MGTLPENLKLQRIVPLKEAAELRGCSEDTIKRHHPDKIIKVSARRLGMRLADALMLGADSAGAA
jgi:hypothetical protein